MKPIETQMNLADISTEYRAFVDKFKPKKTTDDCYTPEPVYNAILSWAVKEYGIDPARVVRPFWPGEDYQRYPYKEGDIVLDNPPFSILASICNFYCDHEIGFFLFAPYLTNFSGNPNVSHIITDCDITYENGAKVNTAFLTNLDPYLIRSAPDLARAMKAADVQARNISPLPKYAYPPEVLTATAVGALATAGVDFRVKRGSAFFIRGLQDQKQYKKTIFGGGFLLSEKATADRIAAEKAAAEKSRNDLDGTGAPVKKWILSENEKRIIKNLE